ncbi:MAG: hypothetical protein ACFFE2_10325 [Candidatus Thorarchaeota archaeon]
MSAVKNAKWKNFRFVVLAILVSTMMFTSMMPLVEASSSSPDHGLRTSWTHEKPTLNGVIFDEDVGNVEEGEFGLLGLACQVYSYSVLQEDYDSLNLRVSVAPSLYEQYAYNNEAEYYYVDVVTLDIVESINKDYTAIVASDKASSNLHYPHESGDYDMAQEVLSFLTFGFSFVSDPPAKYVLKPIKLLSLLAGSDITPAPEKMEATRYDEGARLFWDGYNRDEAFFWTGIYFQETKGGVGFVDLNWKLYKGARDHEITLRATTILKRVYLDGGWEQVETVETLSTEVPLTLFETGYEKANGVSYNYGSGDTSYTYSFNPDDMYHVSSSERVLTNPWRPDSLADKLTYDYSFRLSDTPPEPIRTISIGVIGGTNGPEVDVRVWNYDTNRWNVLTNKLKSDFTPVFDLPDDNLGTSHISSNGDMKIRISKTLYYGSPFTVSIDAVYCHVIYDIPTYNVGWNANTTPYDGYCHFRQFESDYGITYHLDSVGSGDYGYHFYAYIKHDSTIPNSQGDTILIDANGEISLRGWFKQYDTFYSYLVENRRLVYIYVMYADNPYTIVRYHKILDYPDGTSWRYKEATITGLDPGRAVYLGIGRPDHWSHDWQLTVEWAQIQINPLPLS